jgi:hypothetical protein
MDRIITPEGFDSSQQITTEHGAIYARIAREQLEGVGIHGFNFAGLEAHAMHPVFEHEELDLKIYAVPNQRRTGAIHVQVEADTDSVFRKELHGKVVEEIEAPKRVTAGQFLERIRDFIEENLLRKSRREELRSGEEQEG